MTRFLLALLCCSPLYVAWAIYNPLQNNIGANSRIIGGFETNIRAYPFIAAINVETLTSRFFCGGSLYGAEWVLTGAQCADGATLFTISFGSATLTDEDPNRLTVATSTYILHPEYNPLTLENDIAIIQLRMPIVHTDFIRSVNFLPSEDIVMGIQVYAFGWGQTSDSDSSLSNKLQIAYIGPITNEQCKITYGNQITDRMVCIVGNYNQGICHGDTGSPLIRVFRTGVTVHDGIASFMSSNGCETTDPSGFTRTYPYNEWIESTTGLDLNVTRYV